MQIEFKDLTAYDVEATGELLGLTPATIRKYIKEKKIKAQKVGRKWFVTDETIKNFLKGE